MQVSSAAMKFINSAVFSLSPSSLDRSSVGLHPPSALHRISPVPCLRHSFVMVRPSVESPRVGSVSASLCESIFMDALLSYTH